jgi:hypothetical protein
MSFKSVNVKAWQLFAALLKGGAMLLLFCTATGSLPAQEEIIVQNGRKYHKQMSGAAHFAMLLKIPFGNATNQVIGGKNVMPPAFRFAEDGGIWVLDPTGEKLKCFMPDGSLEKTITLSGIGSMIVDFALARDGSFAFLDDADGYVIFSDAEGKRTNEVEGLGGARQIEFARNGDLFVDFPVMKAVLRFSRDGELLEEYPYKHGLSHFTSPQGELFGLNVRDRDIFLYKRLASAGKGFKVLVKTSYAGAQGEAIVSAGQVIGIDEKENVYFYVTVGDEMEVIYQERLYRVSPEGRITSETDALLHPLPEMKFPRKFVVTPDGRIESFYADGDEYVLCALSLP